MKRGGVLGGVLLLVVATGVAAVTRAPEPSRSPLDALEGLQWSGHRVFSPRDLRGQVTLVEFWTFDCINCRRTVPAMKQLASTYRGTDVFILGIHTPELDHERVPANVRRALEEMKISFPVALDNDFKVWRAFGNRYWPALYLIDRAGVVRHRHVGELHVGTASWTDLIRKIEALRAD